MKLRQPIIHLSRSTLSGSDLTAQLLLLSWIEHSFNDVSQWSRKQSCLVYSLPPSGGSGDLMRCDTTASLSELWRKHRTQTRPDCARISSGTCWCSTVLLRHQTSPNRGDSQRSVSQSGTFFANVAADRKLWGRAVGVRTSVTLCTLLVFSQQQISSDHAGCVARPWGYHSSECSRRVSLSYLDDFIAPKDFCCLNEANCHFWKNKQWAEHVNPSTTTTTTPPPPQLEILKMRKHIVPAEISSDFCWYMVLRDFRARC